MRRLLRTLICQARVTTIPDKLAELVFMFFIIKGCSKFQEVQHYSRGKTILISAFLFFLVFLFQQKLPGEICVTQTGILDILVLFNQPTNIFYTITTTIHRFVIHYINYTQLTALYPFTTQWIHLNQSTIPPYYVKASTCFNQAACW